MNFLSSLSSRFSIRAAGWHFLFLLFFAFGPAFPVAAMGDDTLPGEDRPVNEERQAIEDAIEIIASPTSTPQELETSAQLLIAKISPDHWNRVCLGLTILGKRHPEQLDAVADGLAPWIRKNIESDLRGELRLCQTLDFLTFATKLSPEVIAAIAAIDEHESKLAFAKPRAWSLLARHRENDRESLRKLIAQLQNDNPNYRGTAIGMLGRLKERAKEALPDLKQRLADDDSAVRVLAAGAVWQIAQDDEAVLNVLIEALSEEPDFIVMRPWTFGESGYDHIVSALGTLELMGSKAKPAVEAIIPLLSADDESHRLYAAQAIGEIGVINPEIERLLRERLNDPNGYVKYYAQEALDKLEKNEGTANKR